MLISSALKPSCTFCRNIGILFSFLLNVRISETRGFFPQQPLQSDVLAQRRSGSLQSDGVEVLACDSLNSGRCRHKQLNKSNKKQIANIENTKHLAQICHNVKSNNLWIVNSNQTYKLHLIFQHWQRKIMAEQSNIQKQIKSRNDEQTNCETVLWTNVMRQKIGGGGYINTVPAWEPRCRHPSSGTAPHPAEAPDTPTEGETTHRNPHAASTRYESFLGEEHC